MNITLQSNPQGSKLQQSSSPAGQKNFKKNIHQQQTQSPFYSNCPGFVFSNCQGNGDRLITEQNQILQNFEKIKYNRKKQKDTERSPKFLKQQSNRKYKICLSLRQSQQKYQTPKKRNYTNDSQKKCYSSIKNNCIFQKSVQNNKTDNKSQQKIVHLNRKIKIKTQPAQQRKSLELNIHQLKESLKPSTNIMTPANKSSKQSNNSSSRKVQLTISNNFKSSMAHQKKQTQSKMCPTSFTGKKIESPFISQQVFVQESFMTAKLHNIYGQIHHSFMQHPSSNIVYYNQIMANEAMWKHPQTLSYSDIKKEELVLPSKEVHIPSEIKKRVVIKNTSILHNIEDEEQKNKMNSINEEDKVDIREKFMQRKYIGQYAKTIKTFNQSQFKSEHESVVLEHGLPGNFPNFLINRGSIKEYPREPQSQIIKRQCSSFGEDHQNSYQIVRERYKEYVNQPIQQSSLDSQKQS